MAYLFYFLGFVSTYRLSEFFAEDDTPSWYHLVMGLLWPLIIVASMIWNLRNLIVGKEEQ